MGLHLYIDDNIHVKALNGLFDPKISKVYFERAIKVKRHLEEPHHVPSLQNRSSRRVERRIISFLSINFYSMLLAISSLIIRLFHSWTFPVSLLAFMDGLYVSFQVVFPAKCLIAGLAILSSPVANVFFLAFMDGLYVSFQGSLQAKRLIAGLAIRCSPVADMFFLAFMDGLYVCSQVVFPAKRLIAGLAIRSSPVAYMFFLAFMDGLYVSSKVVFPAKRFIAGLAIGSSPVADVFFLAFMGGLYVCFQVDREFSLFGGGRADQVISGAVRFCCYDSF